MTEKPGWKLRSVTIPSLLKKRSKKSEEKNEEKRSRNLQVGAKALTTNQIFASTTAPATGTEAMADPAEKKLTSEQKEARNRRLYLKVRLPDLRDEMKGLRKESAELSEKLKEVTAPMQQKALRERRIFITQHLKTLKSELAALTLEHKELAAKPRA